MPCLGFQARMLDIMSMVMPYLDLHICMHVLCSYACVYAFVSLYAWIYVLPCFYAYIHMLRSTFTCLHACFLAYMFYMLYTIFHVPMHSMPCLCTQTQAMFVMPCAIVVLLSLCFSFLCFGLMVRTRSRPYGLCHRPYTSAHIKGFGSPYLHVYACLLLCFMLLLASLDLGFAMFDALSRFVVVWLYPSPTRPCQGVTTWDASPNARSLHAYPSLFLLHEMLRLPCLFVPLVGFLCIFTCFLTCPRVSLVCQSVVHTSTQ